MDTIPTLLIIGFTNIDENRVLNKKMTILPGGAGYFVALAASRVYQPVGLVTRIGLDFDPTFLYSRVLHEGIKYIKNKKTSRSIQTYFSASDLSQRDITLKPGVSSDVCPSDIPIQWLLHAKHIHIATMPPHQQALFMSFIREKNSHITISIDTDQYLCQNQDNIRSIQKLFKQADMVFVNRQEYALLRDAIDRHPYAIVKQDKDGAILMCKGKIVTKAEISQVSVVDATGAGDVFAGIYLGCMMKGRKSDVCLKESVKAATLFVTQTGIDHLFS